MILLDRFILHKDSTFFKLNSKTLGIMCKKHKGF